jgi:hypothetical protein
MDIVGTQWDVYTAIDGPVAYKVTVAVPDKMQLTIVSCLVPILTPKATVE